MKLGLGAGNDHHTLHADLRAAAADPLKSRLPGQVVKKTPRLVAKIKVNMS